MMAYRKAFLQLVRQRGPSKLPIREFGGGSSAGESPRYLGMQMPTFTNSIEFVNKDSYKTLPIYRVLDKNSIASDPQNKLDDQVLMLNMYKNMVKISVMDKILYESQRQGRISFYMTNSGEEALQTGSAAALTINDVIYAQYREAGVLMWRGYNYRDFINQCYGNLEDPGKGKQMPVHYGSKKLNFVTISSPLTTQLPQAVGAAYALKQKQKQNDGACVVCYFGEGAASEGDFHAALNMSATLDCPIIFICRNNGYAISTPSTEQYRGDGIAARGPAYGINTLRVDGNDILAMYHATQRAKQLAISQTRPVLIEAMTYRAGHHSTSDDSSAYRSKCEIDAWTAPDQSPLNLFRRHLIEALDIWSPEDDAQFHKSMKEQFLRDFAKAEKTLKPSWQNLFTDVYQEMPEHIRRQMNSMDNHLRDYGKQYPMADFKA